MEGIPVTDANFEIPLYPGWNQIGHPFNGNVPWGNVSIRKDGVTSTLLLATGDGWVNQWLYAFIGGGYDIRDAATGVLTPKLGYWFRVNQPGATLIIPKP